MADDWHNNNWFVALGARLFFASNNQGPISKKRTTKQIVLIQKSFVSFVSNWQKRLTVRLWTASTRTAETTGQYQKNLKTKTITKNQTHLLVLGARTRTTELLRLATTRIGNKQRAVIRNQNVLDFALRGLVDIWLKKMLEIEQFEDGCVRKKKKKKKRRRGGSSERVHKVIKHDLSFDLKLFW